MFAFNDSYFPAVSLADGKLSLEVVFTSQAVTASVPTERFVFPYSLRVSLPTAEARSAPIDIVNRSTNHQSADSLVSQVSEQSNVKLPVTQMSYLIQKNINYKTLSAILRYPGHTRHFSDVPFVSLALPIV